MIISRARRNARLVILTSFFSDLAFVLPIWFLYSINYLHLSPTLAAVLFTGVFCVSGLFEIPTGAIADRVGRKKAFVLGKMLFLIYPLAYVFGFPLPLFLACTIIAGFGNSLSSGALTPLVHADYEAAGTSRQDYHLFFVRSQAALFIARVISGIGGAWLYTIHPVLPFVGWAVATVCNIIIGVSIKEQHIADKTITYRAHIGVTLKRMLRSEIIFSMLIMGILIGLVTEAVWTGYQAFYDQDGQSPLVIGALFSLIALFGAVTVLGIRRFFARLSPFKILLVGSLLTTATALLLYQPNEVLRLLAVLPMAVAAGFIFTVIQVTIQTIIPNKFQSTALAANNMVTYGVYFVGSVWVSWVINQFGVNAARQTLFIAAIISLLLITFISLYESRKHGFRLEDKATPSAS